MTLRTEIYSCNASRYKVLNVMHTLSSQCSQHHAAKPSQHGCRVVFQLNLNRTSAAHALGTCRTIETNEEQVLSKNLSVWMIFDASTRLSSSHFGEQRRKTRGEMLRTVCSYKLGCVHKAHTGNCSIWPYLCGQSSLLLDIHV